MGSVVALSALVARHLAIHLRAFETGEDGLVFHIAGRPVVRAMASKYMRRAAAKAERARSIVDASLGVPAEHWLSTEAV